MGYLNYNHLYYFWVVATRGSIANAAKSLHVTPQTISGQLRTLEARLGSLLFHRTGSKLELTETGQVVRSYAEPMFNLGAELCDVLKSRLLRCSSPLAVGVATGMPKLVKYRLLAPALDLSARSRVVCYEAPAEVLAPDLLARKIDLAFTDSPMPSTGSRRVQSHLVGQCGVTVFCASDLAEHYKARFPRSLDRAPFALPAKTSALREELLSWFRSERIAPSIVAEIESPDLMSALCETGTALFALPTVIANEVKGTYRVSAVGDARTIVQQFYASRIAREIGCESLSAIITATRERFSAEVPPTLRAEPDNDSWSVSRARSDASMIAGAAQASIPIAKFRTERIA